MGDPASEPTTTGRDSEETAIAPCDTETSAVELAWSVADPAPDANAFADGRRPLPKTLLVFLAGIAVAAVALSAFILGRHEPAQVDTAPTQPNSTAPPPTPSMAHVPPPHAAPQPTSTTSVAPSAPPPVPEPAPPVIAAPSPPVPQPTSPDDAFIARLQADRITFDSQAVAVSAAREVCLEFSVGNSGPNIAAAVKADNPSLSDTRAADFVRLSVSAYCPQYKGD